MNFKHFAQVLSDIEQTDSRLAKTNKVCKLLTQAEQKELETVTLFLQGRIIPAFKQGDLGLASKTVAKTIGKAFGYENEVIQLWREKGDLGDVASIYADKKKQTTLFSQQHSLTSAHNIFRKIMSIEGDNSVERKEKQLSKLLTSGTAEEAKFYTRLAIGNLRVGLGEGTLRDAIAWAFLDEAKPNYNTETESIHPESRETYEEYVSNVQGVLDKTNDFNLAVKKAKQGDLETGFIHGRPAKAMLAQRSKSMEDIFDTLGRPAAFEYKYDGVRMQIHYGEKMYIFTRRLENVTKQFPEVKTYLDKHLEEDVEKCILDVEAVGYRAATKTYVPFQEISRRIKRKYDIEQTQKEMPVELKVFDILSLNEEDISQKPYSERRNVLCETIKEKPFEITLAEQLITEDKEEALTFFEKANSEGNEGLMAKSLSAVYQPGNRVGSMLKYKAVLDDLDVVIVGAEWGQGKRKGWLTSYTIACRDGEEYKTVGKIATGLKEKPEEGFSFKQMTKLLEPHITETDGRNVNVEPNTVITVRFEEVQKSPSYTSGYALRFPRFIAYRPDKDLGSITSLQELKTVYEEQ